nr:Arc family DNA-binding protein [Acinetobacter ursingii]
MSSGHLNAQYNLRWPEGLKEKVAQSAKDHNRSMNADIVARLEQSFEPKKTTNPI